MAYPILVGRQHPEGHPEYPRMGSFFVLQGGRGHYPDNPSPPSNRAAAVFLDNHTRLPAAELEAAELRTVASIMRSLTSIQVRYFMEKSMDPLLHIGSLYFLMRRMMVDDVPVSAQTAFHRHWHAGGSAAHGGDALAHELRVVHQARAELLGAGGDNGRRAAAVEVDLIEAGVAQGLVGRAPQNFRIGSTELQSNRVFHFGAAEHKLAVDVVLLEKVISHHHFSVQLGPCSYCSCQESEFKIPFSVLHAILEISSESRTCSDDLSTPSSEPQTKPYFSRPPWARRHPGRWGTPRPSLVLSRWPLE